MESQAEQVPETKLKVVPGRWPRGKRQGTKKPRGKVTSAHRKVARLAVQQGVSLGAAFEQSGFSRKQGEKGQEAIIRSEPMMRAFKEEIQKMKNKAELLPDGETTAKLVRVKALENAFLGERHKGSNEALKILARDPRQQMSPAGVNIGIFSNADVLVGAWPEFAGPLPLPSPSEPAQPVTVELVPATPQEKPDSAPE